MRVAIYARVSRDSESAILDHQVTALREYCASRGFEIAREYVEIAPGTDGRSVLGQLLQDASLRRGRPWEGVVFQSLSRVTRGGIGSALSILQRLEACGVSWYFAEQPLLDFSANTPQLVRDVLLAILASVDRDYRDRISRATRAAYQRRRALAVTAGVPLRWGRPRKGPPLRPVVPVLR